MIFKNVKIRIPFTPKKVKEKNVKRRSFSFQNGVNILGIPEYITIVEEKRIFNKADHNGGEESLRIIKFI